VSYTIVAKHILQKGGTSLETRIVSLRKERKLSQEELALAVGVTRQTITSIEVGKYTASLPLAFKIAYFFRLAIEDVFDFSEYISEMEVNDGEL
jgi:putative transcriptional regulator